MNNINIRQAVHSDIETLVPMFDAYRQFYGRESDPLGAREFLFARFNHGESTLFIAHEADTGIGFAQLYPSFSSTSLARAFILNGLFVYGSHRREGVGKLLIGAAIDCSKSLGATRVTLSTAINNAPAHALYRSCGWKPDEQFVVYHHTI